MTPTIHVHPADGGGCGHYRMIWPAEALIAEGYDITYMKPGTSDANLMTTATQGRDGIEHIVDVEHPGCDIIVLQRPLHYQLLECIPLLQAKGVQVVVELDDDFENIHPRNIAWSMSHPNMSPERNWRFLKQACSLADRMVVSTPALQRYKLGAVVVPNFVPRWYTELPVDNRPDTPTVGWSGSTETHPQDLQEVGNSVARLMRDGWDLKIVGTGKGVARAFGIREDTDMHNGLGWVDLDTYPVEMQRMSVGMVPLQSSPFNQAKSWLKGLEWASLGVPFVASPTQQYIKLSDKYGIGTISLKAKHWYSHVNNMNYWAEGQKARESVIRNKLIIEERAEMWYNAWVGKS